MIVDTSAIMAIILHEPERTAFTDALFDDAAPVMSAGTFVELTAVLTRRDPELRPAADTLLRAANISIEPLDVAQAKIAAAAYGRFGKGTGHPAGLNVGDCFAYALAKARDEPLLFKGDAFSRTDVRPAIAWSNEASG